MTVIRHDSIGKEEENQVEDVRKLRYPKSIFFIVVTEFCERFSYYGMRAVLTIYMRNVLNFSEDLSTTIYHIFLLLCYGLPLFGGILADSFIGKYWTIVYLSSVYALGNVVLTAASIQPLHLPVVALSLTGLLLMAIGTGGIKPCVVALGGEQFVLPAQEKILKQFFAVFLFAVSIGNMVATVSTPVLRRDVSCFGEDTCYPLAFGVPGILMAVAISVFIGGRCLYKIKPPDENIFVRVIKCAVYAIKEKLWGNSEKKKHWLDYASDRYDEQLVKDSKGLFRVLIYYLPVPMFFALYEQLGSRWTLQATRMNGYIAGGFVIKPDQMQVANAILLFIFIPFFETVVYPIFHKCNLLNRPLQKMVVGGVLASLAFTSAGIVESKIHTTYNVAHANGDNYLNFINTLSCPVLVQEQGHLQNINSQLNGSIAQAQFNSMFKPTVIPAQENLISQAFPPMQKSIGLVLHIGENCSQLGDKDKVMPWQGQMSLDEGVHSVVIAQVQGKIVISVLNSAEVVGKSKEGNAKLRVLLTREAQFHGSEDKKRAIGIEVLKNSVSVYHQILNSTMIFEGSTSSVQFTSTFEVEPNTYQIGVVWQTSKNETETTVLPTPLGMGTGGSYIVSIHGADSSNSSDPIPNLEEELYIITQENQVHMLWLLPQYVLIAWAEVLFIISGMEFSFTEAPESMKSVVQSCWHLANATGNAIVIISAQLNINQISEFFGFATLMGIDTLILCLMSIRYTYVGQAKRSTSISRPTTVSNEVESKF